MKKFNYTMCLICNTLVALGAWGGAVYLFIHAHPVAGSFMMIMPLLFHFDWPYDMPHREHEEE